MSNLVLIRKVGERVMLGCNVSVEVVEVRSSGKVKLMFSAPLDIPILRQEVYDKALKTGTEYPELTIKGGCRGEPRDVEPGEPGTS